jgi:hypothetical protein
MTDPKLQAAKAEAVKEYLEPNGNIVGVGVGTKNGTEEKCVRIYVVQRKEDENSIAKKELISKKPGQKKMFSNVPADVIAIGPFGRHRKNALKDTGTTTQPGSPIRVKTDIDNIDVGARGTLGVVVTDGGTNYVLSCNHILAMNGRVPDSKAATIVSAELVGREVEIGHRDVYVEIQADGKPNAVDCALARINGSAVDPRFPENTVKLISQELAEPQLGKSVSKVGAGTFFRKGRIVDTDVDLYVPYSFMDPALFEHQFVIESAELDQEGNQVPFATNGDSGALVVDEDGKAVGMIFASSGTFAVACPIDKVLLELEARVKARLSLVVASGSTNATAQSQYPE